ncbi:hypothetical protein [Flavobacterium foetidum]|uniref:hypothetical protein n=1 Tax=Flavobacterium foetidum TaxID=2026681 RepID=UPI0010755449|nr:hypothetical protein [Flavobacterium foetidum]KAF2517943.1 hypothetical protein E0W73_01655 [Flavobacterium foetidum]
MKKISYFFFITITLLSCNQKDTSDLRRNYNAKSKEINELKEYFDKIIPKGYIVSIRYYSSDNINLSVYEPTNVPGEGETLFQQWDVDFKDYTESDGVERSDVKTTSLEEVKKKLNWNNDTFKEIYSKLDDVNCIGISNGNPLGLEYGYKGMGVLSYLIFDKNLNKEDQKKYSDNCSTMFYKDNVVFTFSSGATGSFCIPEFKKHK